MAVTPSNFAASAGNTCACTINAGDLVIVYADNQDNTTPAGISDNGAGGGNVYASLGTANFGGSIGAFNIWFCFPAIAATSVTFTGGHVPGLGVATFTGANNVRTITAVTGLGSSAGGTVSTIAANSYLLMSVAYWKAVTNVTAQAPVTGTLQVQATSNGSTNPGIAFVTISTPTVGSYSPAVSLSAGSVSTNTDFIEIMSNTVENYLGVVPPIMSEIVLYALVPTFGGTSGGPVTPVPIGAVLKGGTVGVAYSETISAQGGTGTGYTYAVTGGALPTGTSINSSTGVISGTPTTATTYTFTIQVTDSLLNTGTQSFSITISAATIIVSAQILQGGTVGIVYSETITATGGSGGYSFAVTSGALPTGLTLGAGTGIISGTPTVAGTYNFTITATDSSGNTGSQAFEIIVVAGGVTVSNYGWTG